ncbi:hypothetical protein INT43_003458 [Umbelopsis isabellina]|uniref:polynucleotide adenylyltransferase n=1 Tax=Mortierella isabellina TaxID=91625 RepID=A0A8H7UCT2_MORIS|nr:hypothetical protein INT43_003458 [Umbelopsis isabellina]
MNLAEDTLLSKALGDEHQSLENTHTKKHVDMAKQHSNLTPDAADAHPSSYYPVPAIIKLASEPLDVPPEHLESSDENMLCYEALSLYESLLPTKESHERRNELANKINSLLKAEWPSCDFKLHVFGSSQNRLGTNFSDVDICVETTSKDLENVRILAKGLKKYGMQRVQCIPWAKVPIVRLWDKDLNLACDINVNNTIALCNTRMIRTYIDIDPRVRPLAMIIKHWAKQRQLSDAGNGGTLSTYAWTCMILNFLQMRQPPILPTLHDQTGEKPPTWFNDDLSSLRGFGKANNESVAGLLYAFFRHFAVEFDYSYHVMSLRYGKYLDKHSKGWDFGRNYRMLCIEEPFDTSRNLGNSVDDISVFGLRKEFQRGVAILYEQCNLSLLCEPYKYNHVIQPVNDSSRADESSPTSETSVASQSLQAPVWVKPKQPPSIRSITEDENDFRPPIRKIDLDTIHTDTVARVKLPRHRPVVKTFP